MTTCVVKVGVAALADGGWLDRFATHGARLSERTAIVHGAGLELRAALLALAMGVSSVRIGTFQTLHDASAGTRIRLETEVLQWQS